MIVYFNKLAMNRVMTPTAARAAIAALNDIIATLMGAAAASALNGNIKEYKVDDGQIKAQFEYKDAGAIAAQIKALMSLQQLYLQMPGLNSRVIRLVDASNMPSMLPWGTGFGDNCTPVPPPPTPPVHQQWRTIKVTIRDTPDPLQLIAVGVGKFIQAQYASGATVVPMKLGDPYGYLAGRQYQLPIVLDDEIFPDTQYDSATGTFSGGFGNDSFLTITFLDDAA